jgi:hypothetical protein
MRLLAAALAISVTGCSFVFVDGPPREHAKMPTFDCSTSTVVPILDSLFGGLELANFIYTATRTQQDWNDIYKGQEPFSRHEGLAIYGALTAVSGLAAWYGFSRVSQCREAKQELMARMSNPETPTPAPGWPPPAPPVPPMQPVQPPVQEPAPVMPPPDGPPGATTPTPDQPAPPADPAP